MSKDVLVPFKRSHAHPQPIGSSSKWKYIAAMTIYAVLALYMMVAAVFILVKAIKGGTNASLYAQIVISLVATFGSSNLSSRCIDGPMTLIEYL